MSGRTFSLNDGGPWYRALRRGHLIDPRGKVRARWFVAAAWLPIAASQLVRLALGRELDPMVLDISMHVRLLVALPMLLLAERMVESGCRSAIRSVHAEQLVDDAAIDRLVARAEHLRDAALPEIIVGIAAVAIGQLTLWGTTGPAGVFHGETGGTFGFARVWYGLVALPLAQFVMLRWLWRWAIWNILLARLARMPLAILATHPDRAAGLSALARPVSGYSAFAFAVGAVLSGAWGTQILLGHAGTQTHVPALLVFLFVILTIGVGPMLLFCGHLFRVRRRSLAQYGDFAAGYMRGFHARWIASERSGERALGTPDIQSLNDLGGAYGVIQHTRLFAFGMRVVLMVWASAIVPMLPVFADLVTVEKVLQKIATTILGGLPL